MKIILNALYKGGVGKTTNNVILAHELAERGYKVLFLDFDPQMSATRFLSQKSISDSLFQAKNIFKAVVHNDLKSNIISLKPNIDYVPGHEYINLFENVTDEKKIVAEKRHLYLQILLKPILEGDLYDFVILDISPSKSTLNTAVMSTATHHIITTQSEVLSVEMVSRYMNDIQELQEIHGIPSEIIGISVAMKDQSKLSNQIIQEVNSFFRELVFRSIVKRKSKIAQYVATGYPNLNKRGKYSYSDGRALEMYWNLTDEILFRLQLPRQKEAKAQ